ncbi:MAG: amino acid adenylation domain-containing protein, partial [Thermoanaerobaculia bacterium]
VFGGEAADPERVRAVVTAGAPDHLLNAYGPTECTTIATTQRVAAVEPGALAVPIGRAIAGARCHVLDQDQRPVAVGEAGELHIGGQGLARGYLRRPALTAESFVPDPFGDVGSRLYRTGDRVRVADQEGVLEFVGRRDDQVKLRGFRVEPKEVEAVLATHPGITAAAVLPRRDARGELSLVAYAAATGNEAAAGTLRDFLAGRLPHYMVPAAVVVLETMPLTPNGKVDRDALRRIEPPATPGEPEPAAKTPLEELVAGIWSQVLGLEHIGRRDNFFELGGHSLAGAQVVSRLRQALGYDLSPLLLFEAATVEELGRVLEDLGHEGGRQALPPIGPAARDQPLPLSLPQERVWFLAELAPGNLAYNTQLTVRFEGPLRVAVLARALTEVVRRHEVLRTTFAAGADSRPLQTIHPPPEIRPPVVDLSQLPAAVREQAAEGVIAVELARPFAIDRLPLVRWTLLRMAPEDHMLVQVEHHFVHDGWSLAVLLREIKVLYQAFVAGRPSPLPELPIQFADFAVWQRQWLQGEVLDRLLAYWQNKIGEDPGLLPLSTDFQRPARPSHRGDAKFFDLPQDLYRDLRQLSRRQGVTLFMTTLAAFALLLERHSGRDDLCIGSAVANRRLRETEGLIGMLVNTLPLRIDLSGDPTFAELLARVRETVLEATVHQDLPLERLVAALQPKRDSSYTPLFQVVFAFHDSAVPDLSFAGLRGRLRYRHNRSAKFDMNVVLIPRSEQRLAGDAGADDRLSVIWEYSTDLFGAATIERLVRHYRRLLAAAVADPERRISALSLLGAGERQQLLVEWSRPAGARRRQRGLPQLIAAQAVARPQAPALVATDGSVVSYRELEARAARLAGHLAAQGVGPEVLVGILLERSPELVVAQLAVLKAGGAYLPLDPASPPRRWAFMVGDAGVRVVLTDDELARRLPAAAAQVIRLDADGGRIAASAPTLAVVADPRHLAYVIYTSGSTGRPKAVTVTHGALMNLIGWHLEAFEPRPEERATQLARVSFDASVWEVWPYLVSGSSLCFPDDETLAVPAQLRDWLLRNEIHLTFLPTPLAERMLELEWPPTAPLRVLLTGGDKLRRRPPGGLPFELVNNYGPTENAVVATSAAVAAAGDATPTLGRPISGVEAHVLDRRLRPVAIGVAGELCLGGASLARGYLGRPALTAQAFVPHPWSRRPGGRLYRTGDLVRRRPDGSLDFLGRIDHQVKLRGLRIELGEIEAVLRRHPAVADAAVVVGREHGSAPSRGPALVASVVTDAEVGELRAHLRQRLPDYMVPSFFTVLEQMPLTANGKVDRAALERRVPSATAARRAADEVRPPRTASERALAAVWQETLAVEEVGLDDDFFDLGGHSLLLVQVRDKLQQRLQRTIRITDLLNVSTLRELARHLDQAAEPTPEPAVHEQRLEQGKHRLKRQLLRMREGVKEADRHGS